MIQITIIDGLNCPCAFCDYCDKVIERDGILVWKYENPKNPLMLHKGECDSQNNVLRGKFDMSLELDQVIDDLLHNVALKQPNKRARLAR